MVPAILLPVLRPDVLDIGCGTGEGLPANSKTVSFRPFREKQKCPLISAQFGKEFPIFGFFDRMNRGFPFTRRMRKVKTSLDRALRHARRHWREFLLGIAIVFTTAAAAWLYSHGCERAERAALAIGGTLVGMLLLGILVCKR
ncbi:hypothetical protein [Achromobacter sp. UMC46]|uniref:hypothetical protein n=1 Tax=Achromobacter sp. UMC46 TaxID=1862319 RepID=UPI0015FF74B4|nr:hypothetical protein [Achromobacter sp. UMC46]